MVLICIALKANNVERLICRSNLLAKTSVRGFGLFYDWVVYFFTIEF